MIRKISKKDRENYLKMAADFYSSAAVLHPIPERYLLDTFDEIMRSNEYLEGYFFEYRGSTAGYALLAKSFSQEAGGPVLWIDELYVKPEYRCHGIGHEFFRYIRDAARGVKRLRLEVESSNQKAVSLYKRMGFKDLPYRQMIEDL